MPKTPVTEIIASELRAIAARKSLRQSAVAVELGVPTMWLSRRFRGDVSITVDDLVLICGALDVDPAELLASTLATT